MTVRAAEDRLPTEKLAHASPCSLGLWPNERLIFDILKTKAEPPGGVQVRTAWYKFVQGKKIPALGALAASVEGRIKTEPKANQSGTKSNRNYKRLRQNLPR